METLENIDKILFLRLNANHSSVMDTLMFEITSLMFWIPLYLFLGYLLYKQFGKKITLLLVCISLLLLLSDQTCNFIKKQVKRYRPSHNIELQDKIHTVNNYKGGTYGFVSSHAANTFAIAVFLILIFRQKSLVIKSLLILWATLVSYSRIYLGVHYPADIVGGMFVGTVYALLVYSLFIFVSNKLYKNKEACG